MLNIKDCGQSFMAWELSKNKPDLHQGITLTLADTTLHYGQELTDTTDSSDVTALTLPAVAFAFSTERMAPEIQASYTVAYTPTMRCYLREKNSFTS